MAGNVCGTQGRDDTAQQDAYRRFGCFNAHASVRSFAKVVNLFERAVEIAERGEQSCQQTFARFGGRDTPSGAMEEANAHPLFERAHHVTHR